MKNPKLLTLILLFVLSLVGTANAVNISGNINATLVITEDSQLVGNVTCGVIATPCIQFGAPNITLRLNSFIITGPANPDDTSTCIATSGASQADLIGTGTQNGVQILGPGMVQKARRHGIFVLNSSSVLVRFVTIHHNCFSGIFGNGMTNSLIENNVSVRNSANSGAAPCGGNCITNSHNNVVRNNHFSGNGSVCPTALCAAGTVTVQTNNDFGIGLVFGSTGNLIEQNQIGGNTNGVLIHANATGNTLRRNTIVGNPPSQISRDYPITGDQVGFDIKDEGTSDGARNTFDGNWCITYRGPLTGSAAPCPRLAPTVLVTTAAGADISGRVLSPQGVGLRSARVWLTDSAGATRETLTSSFGYFSFEDVPVGQTYVIGVASKRYRFAARSLQMTDSLANIDFQGIE
ncbi:MAG: right-handed parallel beta-helix repeat-containing protein [Pyrinomonadaceae bacterium]